LTEIEDDPDLVGLRGATRYGPRWRPVGLRLNAAGRAFEAGDLDQAVAITEEVLHATRDCGDDGEALDVRARALGNRASMAEARGDLDGALRYSEESLAACADAIRLTGNLYGSTDVRSSTLVNRAQTLQALGRAEEALRDLDEVAAAGVAAPANAALLPFVLHNTRGAALMALERYPEAETEIRLALDIAMTSDPRLAGHAYASLAAIAAHTGDEHSATEHLHVARDLRELWGSAADRAYLELNLGRLAARAGLLDDAEERLRRAEAEYERAGRPTDVAECRMSRAMIALRQHRFTEATTMVDETIAALERAGVVPALIESHLVRAQVTYVVTGDLGATEDVFLRARALAAGAGAWHQTARIDVLRAQLVADAAPLSDEPATLYQMALPLAVIAALGTDGFRHRYEPGAMRERWVRHVAMPALSLALRLAAEIGAGDLVFQLVEYISASVSLEAELTAHPSREVRDEPALPAFTAPDLSTRLALPPRPRLLPGDEQTALDALLATAEAEYHLPLRSAEVVPTW
jgi:tetratricopeptide (TPR) repeat protein